MGVGGIFKFIVRRLLEIFVIGAVLALCPNLPPNANFSKPFTVAPFKPLTGTLALNDRLNDVEIWHKGDFTGPEAFADLNGELYTSLHTGDIVKLTGEHITPVVKFGKPCKHAYEERICGRPLGITFDKNGYLIASDSYYGLFRVNVKSGDKEQLVSPTTEIEGKKAKIFNSVAVASNGDIYWTDSSSDFLLEDGLYTLLADGSGRLIHYDAKTKKNKVLINNLQFANGVALSEDEEFIIVAETGMSRIQRYYLKGAKKGTNDIFIDGLPGLPDNLKVDGKGGFLVPLVMSGDADHPIIFQSIGPFPILRKVIARFVGITEYIFKKSDKYFPNEFSAKAVHFIGHFTSTLPVFQSTRSTLLRVNKNGQITDSVHNLNRKISSISEIHVFRDTLYLGSPFNDYIAKIPLAKIGWEDLKGDRVKRAAPVETPKPTEAPKPTTTTPKATTTTPKPTTTTPRPTTTTTTPKPTTTTPKPTTTQKPATTPSPKKQEAPQAKQAPSPVRQSAPPAQQTPPPSKQQANKQPSPTVKEQTPPPVKQQAPPPAKEAPPPAREAPPPTKQAPSPAKQAPSPAKQAPSPAKQAPSPAKQAPSPTKQSPQGTQEPEQKQAPSKQQPTPTKQQPNKK